MVGIAGARHGSGRPLKPFSLFADSALQNKVLAMQFRAGYELVYNFSTTHADHPGGERPLLASLRPGGPDRLSADPFIPKSCWSYNFETGATGAAPHTDMPDGRLHHQRVAVCRMR